jgi:hypothetical protein
MEKEEEVVVAKEFRELEGGVAVVDPSGVYLAF